MRPVFDNPKNGNIMKRYLETGQIVSLHGIKGVVKIYPWSDSAEDILDLDTLYLDEEGRSSVEIVRASVQKNMVLAKLRGYDDAETARKLVGKTVYMDREDIILPEGRFYIADIIGSEVIDADNGTVYGRLAEVTSNGAHDIYHIDTGEKKVLFPAVDEFVDRVDAEALKVYIRPIKGMFS